MAPRYVSPLIVEPGSVFGFATTPLYPSSPPTGRYGALVVLGHNADLVVIGVLDGVWTSLPTLAEVTGRKLMRHSRFESGKKPVAFGFDRKTGARRAIEEVRLHIDRTRLATAQHVFAGNAGFVLHFK